MFVGHYGPAFAAKRVELSIPLWALFIAVQFLDVLWAPFVLFGILAGLQAWSTFLAPAPASDRAEATTALFAYGVLALAAWWLADRPASKPGAAST